MIKRGGLTHSQAAERLAEYGPNVLPQSDVRSRTAIFIDQFKSPLVGLLGVAAGVAAATGELIDAGLIMAIVGINGLLGWVQEYKADDAVKKLKKLGEGKVRVSRSDREMEIESY